MKITLNKDDLRERLRLLAGLEPSRSDVAIEYTDGLDIDALLDQKLRSWYLQLLDKGDMSLLAPSDIAATARLGEGSFGGSSITVPAMCRRVHDIRLGGWKRPARILPPTETDSVVRRQGNIFLAATADRPVAVEIAGGEGGRCGGIMAWPGADSIELLTAVLDAGPDSFTFDESALATLENIVEQINII